ncbi:MAG: IS66 family insertion sequence element accessory protein TnpB [Lachnospiraceae bacterium]
MDRCTHEVRTQYWKEIIQACQQRPEGQSAKQWLKDNGILEQSYYKWQQKFRKEAYEVMNTEQQVSAPENAANISFTEIPVRLPAKNTFSEITSAPAAVIKTSNLTIAISNEISDSLLSRIIREVTYA